MSDGRCGVCGVVGYLSDIQEHFLREHVEEENETEENGNYETCELQVQTENNSEWQEGETKLLLDKYETYMKLVGPMKRFKTKKNMWLEISKDLLMILNIIKTPLQCENRYKTILKRKKKAVDNNQTSGKSRVSIPYEEELNKIASLDDSIEPEVLRDATQVKIKQKPSSSTIVRKKEKSIQEILLEISKEKEEARERRHKEKMDLLKKIFEDKNYSS